MKRISHVIMVLLIMFCLSACKSEDDTRTVVEKEWIYDFIGIKSIEVNEELFTTFCKQEKDRDDGLWNTFGAGRIYKDSNGIEYRAFAISPCLVYYDNTMYHGFDLLESDLLTIEELELLEFPFDEVLD